MGTKNNPGAYDCYANAEPDEPMFVLLGRDRHAADLVRTWALLRHLEGEDEAKVAEALACADSMDRWQITKKGARPFDGDQPWRSPMDRLFLRLTHEMDEMPDDWNFTCACGSCRSYAAEDHA